MTHQATRQPGRRALAFLAALVLLFVVAQYGGALLTGGVYHSDDAANSYYPSHEMTRRALLDGTLPFWEPGSWSGWPAIVDPYHGVYYPLNVLFYVLGGARGLAPTVALHVLIAAAGLFAFLRLRGLGAAACLTGALAYALSNFMVVRVDHVGFIQMAAWVPWILWALDRWLETQAPASLPALAAVCGLAVLAGGGPLGVVAALPMAAYALLRLAQSAKGEEGGVDVRRGMVNAAAVGGAIAVGLMIAAAQLLPSLTHLPESPRALATGYSFASSYAWPDLRYAMTLVWPDLYGNVSRGGYAGVYNYTEIAGYYVGIGAYMLAPFAVFWRAPAARRLELLILALVAVAGFVAALGDAGPVHPILYRLDAALRLPALPGAGAVHRGAGCSHPGRARHGGARRAAAKVGGACRARDRGDGDDDCSGGMGMAGAAGRRGSGGRLRAGGGMAPAVLRADGRRADRGAGVARPDAGPDDDDGRRARAAARRGPGRAEPRPAHGRSAHVSGRQRALPGGGVGARRTATAGAS